MCVSHDGSSHEGIAFLSALAFITLPVVVCMSHEAKPHLAGAVLMLLAALAAMRYVDRGTTAAAVLVGVTCGAAMGMILSSLPVFLLAPVMVLMRPDPWPRRIRVALLALMVGAAAYAVTNPYVLINYLFHRELLMSNVGNYGKFYSVRDVIAGATNAVILAVKGAGPAVAILGVIGWLALHFSPAIVRKKLILLALPAAGVFAQFALLAADKPGEYGRFLLLPDVVLLIGAMLAIARIRLAAGRMLIAGIVCAATAVGGSAYLRGFVNDSRAAGTRAIVQDKLAQMRPAVVQVLNEPAPYCLPPVDLFRTQLLLSPIGHSAPLPTADVLAYPVDRTPADAPRPDWPRDVVVHNTTPISWADKPFVIETRNMSHQGNAP